MFYFYIIALLNVVDMGLTAIALSFHITTEQNPIMRFLWEAHPVYFIFVKLALSILLIIIAIHFPKERYKKWRILLQSTILIYVGVLGMHFVWISHTI
ncbi:glucan phosphoethanolaminetransferase (alkaline phosphatase superfamily) [Salirhabdus euzebyi]|uniref:Glucan phosphoethanolaminetransferase (Alkaline phosphatase superfamily) n=1 Tax=Salirhabdus euzebyi TaxID=394506 RepID=A0A841Q8K5_9BACI|nr:DUF5658 family protein [Salirhabdus euzebyi]MBB6454738.1 glucan phosphoethanolaminetransferase (alkaline phosphatase superfamily) [Salirhabdus euzebyi]